MDPVAPETKDVAAAEVVEKRFEEPENTPVVPEAAEEPVAVPPAEESVPETETSEKEEEKPETVVNENGNGVAEPPKDDAEPEADKAEKRKSDDVEEEKEIPGKKTKVDEEVVESAEDSKEADPATA